MLYEAPAQMSADERLHELAALLAGGGGKRGREKGPRLLRLGVHSRIK
ncbi:MAG: hypothetical protein NTU94_15775 [Planctomycetota bacterium]|nr:hypothetical protein [Planctomycetota bacterium]